MESVVFCCQSCKARLALAGVEQISYSQKNQAGDKFTKPEDSFVLLESKRKEPFSDDSSNRKPIDESFIVLGPLSLASQRDTEDDEVDTLSLTGASDLDEKLRTISRIFELASEESGTDHPLCVDCASQVRTQMDIEKRAIEAQIAEYSEAVRRLEKEDKELFLLSDSEFEQKLAEAEAEFEAEKAEVEKMEKQVEEAEMKLNQLSSVSEKLDDLEENYWDIYNAYSLKNERHVDEKAAIINRINLAAEKLAALRKTNVCLDAFRIDHDGPFGTISGFRLGRTPDVHVDWDEINAAWGQAVLLLYTLANLSKFTFSVHRLVPMGSKPKIVEKRGVERIIHSLYGPVNRMFSFSYDRAMVIFLSCIKEFADFAHSQDLNDSHEDAFDLPFAIEGDKIDGKTIKLYMNKDVLWTKALKFMLADLLACMQWVNQRKTKN